MDRTEQGLRIGALAERVGATEAVLRVWERRYGLFDPVRTAAGYRLYGPTDQRRAAAMVRARDDGVPAAQAAAAILAAERRREGGGRGRSEAEEATAEVAAAEPERWVEELLAATARFDHVATHALLDRAVARLSVEGAIQRVVLPAMRRIGDGWAVGAATVEQEHFASEQVKARLATLGAGLGQGGGPLVLLACLPGERHDLGLKAFELVLLRRGYRTRYLGADTPTESIGRVADAVAPDLVVLVATRPGLVEERADDLRSLADRHPLALAGAGVHAATAVAVGARHLEGDPVTAPERLPGVLGR